ncbi:hypothetical protein KSP40_PGU006604 [Platanthera guangdongensis]|uniref:Uncharacterized protein n=1 Tax=Platanthera guangdongensis TaxID=2320717 RepID=A0ABR2MRT1_9ASPA
MFVGQIAASRFFLMVPEDLGIHDSIASMNWRLEEDQAVKLDLLQIAFTILIDAGDECADNILEHADLEEFAVNSFDILDFNY